MCIPLVWAKGIPAFSIDLLSRAELGHQGYQTFCPFPAFNLVFTLTDLTNPCHWVASTFVFAPMILVNPIVW